MTPTGAETSQAAPVSGPGKHTHKTRMPSRETQGPHASARVTLPWAAASTVVWSIVSGSMDTGITQTPKYLVTAMRSKRTMKREHLGHDSIYCYRQKAKKSLEFMFHYNYKELIQNETVPTQCHT